MLEQIEFHSTNGRAKPALIAQISTTFTAGEGLFLCLSDRIICALSKFVLIQHAACEKTNIKVILAVFVVQII